MSTSHSTGRVRRPADLLYAVSAFVIILVVLGSIRLLPAGSGEVANDVSHWVTHIPHWLSYSAAVVSGVTCFVLVLMALVVLVRFDWRDARNACAAGLAGAAAAIVTTVIWRIQDGTVEQAVLHGRNPSTFVVDTAFVAFAVGTDLTRRSHWSRWWPRSGAALLISGLAVGTLTPYAVGIVLFGGLLVGWLARWLLRTASALPSPAQLIRWLVGHGVPAADLSAPDPASRARMVGKLADGTPIQVRLAGRDTRGAGLARKLWALVRLRRAVAGHVALSSRAQIEQLALSCYLAQQASVTGPVVVLLAEMPSETLALVTTIPAEPPVPAVVSKRAAVAMFAALRALHGKGVAHHDLRPANLFMTEDTAGFRSLDTAEPAASELARRLDVVQLLATLADEVGPADSVTALREGYGWVDEIAVSAVLQPIALAPWGWRAMRAAQGSLRAIRQELLADGEGSPGQVARLERFRWQTVISVVSVTVAVYLLVFGLSSDNLGRLANANPWWVVVAVLASAITYTAAAANLAAFVPKRLSIWLGTRVQLAAKYVGVALPPTVGHLAVNARYLHKEHLDEEDIAAAVALSQIVNIVTTVLLVIVLGVLTGSGFSPLKLVPLEDLLIGGGAIAAVTLALMVLPRTRVMLRDVVWPRIRGIGPRLLDAGSHPLRLAYSIGSNLVLTAAYVGSLLAALWSLGIHPGILAVALAYLAGNAVGSAAPTPGGLLTVEAAMAATLHLLTGISTTEALLAVLIFRIATFWLPIPVGWFCYLRLSRRNVL
jgi:uncharacterized membrane protein YbhN (UPF0104 family)